MSSKPIFPPEWLELFSHSNQPETETSLPTSITSDFLADLYAQIRCFLYSEIPPTILTCQDHNNPDNCSRCKKLILIQKSKSAQIENKVKAQ
jgi:hypothetical protein